MILTNSDLLEIKNIVIEAAIKAGEVIVKYKKKGFSIHNKEGGDSIASQVLTEVDILSQEIILSHLKPLQTKYDLGLLTEESPDDSSRLIKDYFFCIDPMDGTKSFIDSDQGFSVSISLVSKIGESIIAVVYDPVKDNYYSAIKGYGSYKNNNPWSLKKSNNKKLTVIIDPSFDRSKIQNINNIDFIEYGGAVMNVIMVLEGMADCYIKLPKKKKGGGSIWDFSSTTLFCLECGYIASDIYGKPINLNNPNTTFMNEHGVYFSKDNNILSYISHIAERGKEI